MLLTVIVPVFTDNPKKLVRFLKGVLQQTLPRNKFNLIVIDDCSPISLTSSFEVFNSKFKNGNASIIRNKKNKGRSKTRNIGIKASKGDVLLFLDVDNVPQPFAFESILAKFSDRKDKAIRGNVRCDPFNVSHSSYVRFFDSRYLGARGITTGQIAYKYFSTDSLAITKGALKKIGWFDESFKKYGCEDEEMGCRAKTFNIPFYFCQEAKFIDTDSPTLERETSRMYDYALYSLPLLLSKHPSYIKTTLFRRLESASSSQKKFYLFILNKYAAQKLLTVLSLIDSMKVRVPRILYHYVIASFYAEGFKARN